MKKISPRVKGIVCILFAAFGFSMMSVFIRLAGDVPTAEKAFFRNIVALAVVGAMLAVKRVPLKPEKGSWPFITCRAVFGTIGMLLNFYAVDHLVLADANMLNKLSPFFAIIFSVLLLREKPTAVQIGGVLTALLGSVLIIKPGFEGASFVPSLAGFISGAAAGLAYTFVRKLGARGENSLRIVFYFSLFSTLLTLPFFLVSPVQLTGHQLLMLLLCGCSACVAVWHHSGLSPGPGQGDKRLRLLPDPLCRRPWLPILPADPGWLEHGGLYTHLRCGRGNVPLQQAQRC